MRESEAQMTRKARKFRCSAEDVFHVLGNGWLYPAWVVGASRMRNVDAHWPRVGARLKHSVGTWPLLIDDSTSCVEWEPPHRMVFTARGWPIGEAHVELRVTEKQDGCLVEMFEHPKRGPASLLPRVLTEAPLRWRNRESLNRLSFLAEGIAGNRHRGDDDDAHTD